MIASDADTRTDPAVLPAFAVRGVATVAALLAVLLGVLSGRYGYHRDELYFVVAGQHPAWGYIDQPPLTPTLARLGTAVFGDTLVGLRVIPLLLAVTSVAVVALIARELGGDRRAQLLAAACGATSSLMLATGHMLSTSTVDMLVWLTVGWLVLRLLRTGDGRWYVAIGAAVGIGLQNKYLIAFLVVGLLAAVAAVGPRSALRTPWLAAGILVAAAIAAPHVWWQATHGWPQLAVAEGIEARDGVENRALFLPLQLVFTSPVFLPIWLAGLVRLCRDERVRWARSFALAYPLLVVLVLALGGKGYYVVPLLMVPLAAGAEPTLRWAAASPARGRLVAAAVLLSAVVNPIATLPVLPPGAVSLVNGMNKEQGEQIGWPELVDTVAGVWRQIPADERDRAVIVTGNYGEAGAIARYGPAAGLPAAYSGHMSYADWGPPPDDADGPVVVVHYPGDPRLAHFTDCRVTARVDNGYDLDNDEQGTIIELCSGTDAAWSSIWGDVRHV